MTLQNFNLQQEFYQILLTDREAGELLLIFGLDVGLLTEGQIELWEV